MNLVTLDFALLLLLLLVAPTFQSSRGRSRGRGRGQALEDHIIDSSYPHIVDSSRTATSSYSDWRGRGRRLGRGRRGREQPLEDHIVDSSRSATSSYSDKRGRERGRSTPQARLEKFKEPMHPVIVRHVEKSMEKKGIDPRIVLVENDPKDSEEYMQDLYHPFENSPQIRPPTVEEVKHYLYQYMHKDFKFIRQFATARKTRQHGTPARMRQLNQFRNTGVRPDFPHPKWENLVLTNISKHGFTLEQVQESKDTQLVANLVLPPFENQTGAITMANKAQANRVLHHLILKTKKFSDEVLKHVRRVEPPSQTDSQDEGEYEEVSESSGPSEIGSTGEEEEDEEDFVEAYRPEHTRGSSSGYVASPYHFQQQIPESAHMSQDQAFIGRFKEREKRQDEDHTEPSQVVRLSEIVQPSLQQKFAGYGASEDYFPCQLNREASPPESPSPQRQYDDSHPASSSDGQGRRRREGSHG